MSEVHLLPSRLRGQLRAPPSKSYTHRGLVAGHLTGRRYRLRGPLDAEDTRATALGIACLGTPVRHEPGAWVVEPASGAGGPRVTIDCGESGTTLRFLAALAARGTTTVRFTGRARLGDRPMGGLLAALGALGATIRASPRGLPLEIAGPIHAGRVRVAASVSSQFISSLLLALPTLAGDSRIDLAGPVVSAPYLDATVAVLRHHGVEVVREGRSFRVGGGQRWEKPGLTVPGDASSAAYLWAAGAVAGGPVRVTGVPSTWPQADRAVLDLLRSAGAQVDRTTTSATVASGRPRPFRFDFTDSPDLYPLAGVLAAVTEGTSHLAGAPQVAFKESDRRSETARLARAFGARVSPEPGGLAIRGTPAPRGVTLPDLTDHRLLMSAAVGALAARGPSRLGPKEAVRKSFPGFWRALGGLGAEVSGA